MIITPSGVVVVWEQRGGVGRERRPDSGLRADGGGGGQGGRERWRYGGKEEWVAVVEGMVGPH